MNWYLKALKNYVGFSGRARRKEYWMFILFNAIFSCAAIMLDYIFGTAFGGIWFGLFYILYYLAVFLPALAVLIRRLHDIEKSGWFMFISLVPVIGSIWLIVLLCKDGTVGENKYGANPKENV
jgi:uncharacterized membrane protein YhaH (DUF805 family)